MPRRLSRSRRIRLRRTLLAVGLAVVAFLYYRPLRAYVNTKQEVARRQADVRGLEAQKRQLEKQLARAGTPAALAREARTELSLVKPGEHLYIVKGISAWRKKQK